MHGVKTVLKLFIDYVWLSKYQSIVPFHNIELTKVRSEISKVLSLNNRIVTVNTRVLKHMYDKRTAQSFDLLLRNLPLIINNPCRVYKDNDTKRGSLCFERIIEEEKYIAVVELVDNIEVVTAFKTDDMYLKKFEILWELGRRQFPS